MIQVIPEYREKSFGERLGEGLGKSLQQGLSMLGEHYKHKQQQKAFADLAGQLEEQGPQYKSLATVLRSGIPGDQKANLIRHLAGAEPMRNAQQERLLKDSILKRYSSRIKEIDEALKYGTNYEEKEQLQDLKNRLQSERDQLLEFPSLQKHEEMERPFFEEENVDEIESPSAKLKTKKIKFDIRNPKHKARRDEVLKKTQGNQKKAGMVLSKEFDL